MLSGDETTDDRAEITVEVPATLLTRYKAACRREGITPEDGLRAFMRECVADTDVDRDWDTEGEQ